MHCSTAGLSRNCQKMERWKTPKGSETKHRVLLVASRASTLNNNAVTTLELCPSCQSAATALAFGKPNLEPSLEESEGGGVLICHCKAIFERRVREVIAAGARDEFDVAIACGAGTGCGSCVPTVTRLLLEVMGERALSSAKGSKTYVDMR
jgi:bacterioferritin-associated ferredoxin